MAETMRSGTVEKKAQPDPGVTKVAIKHHHPGKDQLVRSRSNYRIEWTNSTGEDIDVIEETSGAFRDDKGNKEKRFKVKAGQTHVNYAQDHTASGTKPYIQKRHCAHCKPDQDVADSDPGDVIPPMPEVTSERVTPSIIIDP